MRMSHLVREGVLATVLAAGALMGVSGSASAQDAMPQADPAVAMDTVHLDSAPPMQLAYANVPAPPAAQAATPAVAPSALAKIPSSFFVSGTSKFNATVQASVRIGIIPIGQTQKGTATVVRNDQKVTVDVQSPQGGATVTLAPQAGDRDKLGFDLLGTHYDARITNVSANGFDVPLTTHQGNRDVSAGIAHFRKDAHNAITVTGLPTLHNVPGVPGPLSIKSIVLNPS